MAANAFHIVMMKMAQKVLETIKEEKKLIRPLKNVRTRLSKYRNIRTRLSKHIPVTQRSARAKLRMKMLASFHSLLSESIAPMTMVLPMFPAKVLRHNKTRYTHVWASILVNQGVGVTVPRS